MTACGQLFRTAEDYRDHLPCHICERWGDKVPLSIKAVQCIEDDGEAIRRIMGEKDRLTGDVDFDAVLRECIEIMATKGSDYMAGTTDRLHNFRQAAEELGISMREVVYVYMWKHLASIRTYCRTGEVKSEGLKSHVTDVINYLLLLYKVEQDIRRQQLHTELQVHAED